MRNISDKDFEEIYYKHKQTLYNIAYSYFKNVSDSDDTVQDVFMKYLNSNNDFKSDEDLKYWLIRVCINACINEIKSTYKKKVMLDNDISLNNDSIKNEDDEIFSYVYNLPLQYKDVIILYYYESYSVDEISKILKISQANVKKRLERGRNILKTKISEDKYE